MGSFTVACRKITAYATKDTLPVDAPVTVTPRREEFTTVHTTPDTDRPKEIRLGSETLTAFSSTEKPCSRLSSRETVPSEGRSGTETTTWTP